MRIWLEITNPCHRSVHPPRFDRVSVMFLLVDRALARETQSSPYYNCNTLAQALKIGMSQEEVIAIFGQPTTEFAPGDSQDYWCSEYHVCTSEYCSRNWAKRCWLFKFYFKEQEADQMEFYPFQYFPVEMTTNVLGRRRHHVNLLIPG